MKTVAGMILIAAVVAVTACDYTHYETAGGFVSGKVTDSATSRPVDSVQVILKYKLNSANSINSVLTDSLGEYRLFSGFYVGSLVVQAKKDGYESQARQVNVVSSQTTTIDFEIQRE